MHHDMRQITRKEVLNKLRSKYARAGRQYKTALIQRIIDLFEYHRKAAIRALRGKPSAQPPRRMPAIIGRPKEDSAEKSLPALFNLCGKRLQALLPEWLPALSALQRCLGIQTAFLNLGELIPIDIGPTGGELKGDQPGGRFDAHIVEYSTTQMNWTVGDGLAVDGRLDAQKVVGRFGVAAATLPVKQRVLFGKEILKLCDPIHRLWKFFWNRVKPTPAHSFPNQALTPTVVSGFSEGPVRSLDSLHPRPPTFDDTMSV